MKTLILIAAVSSLLATSLIGDPEPAPAAPANAQPRPEIERLQQEFAHRRAEALRPIPAWYRGQLEMLRKKLYLEAPGSEAKVAEVLETAKAAFWEEDQPELKQALVRNTWLWRSDYDPHGVAVTFRDDGTVEHVGLHGTWRISGPSAITIIAKEGETYVLRFNTSLSAYEGDQYNVSGVRTSTAPKSMAKRFRHE